MTDTPQDAQGVSTLLGEFLRAFALWRRLAVDACMYLSACFGARMYLLSWGSWRSD